MSKPPSPPPGAAEYLTQLAEYYRELVEYHQRAAIVAAQQLGHVQSLLSDEPVLPYPVDAQSWSLDESQNPRQIPEITSNQVIETSNDEYNDEDYEDNDEDDENDLETANVSLQLLKELLEAERGKMLHIDYILHHFYGSHPDKSQLKPMIEQQLETGQSFGCGHLFPMLLGVGH